MKIGTIVLIGALGVLGYFYFKSKNENQFSVYTGAGQYQNAPIDVTTKNGNIQTISSIKEGLKIINTGQATRQSSTIAKNITAKVNGTVYKGNIAKLPGIKTPKFVGIRKIR